MGVSFPEDYRELLLQYNGGWFVHGEFIELKEPGPYDLRYVNVDSLYGIGTGGSCSDLMDAQSVGPAWDLQQEILESFLFIGHACGAGEILLGLKGKWKDRVYYWWREEYHEPDDLIFVAESLEEFFTAMRESPKSREEEPLF